MARHRYRTLTVFLAALMATVGGAGLALAAAPSSPTPIPPGPVVTASVSCGGDHSRALAGGFLAPDFSIESGRTTVRTKLKRTGRHTWEVGAAALGQETGSILPVGYCTKLRGTQITAAASATVPANEIGTATATCPAGSRAVSGGFESPGFDLTSGHVLPLTSMRVGDKSWQVTGVNPDFGAGVSPAQLIAYAYCLKGKPPITTVSVDVLVVGEGFTPADVNCPSGTRALSGGFDGHPVIDQSGFNAAGSVESYRLSGRTGWRTNAVQAGEQPSTVTTYAYCEPKPPVPPK